MIKQLRIVWATMLVALGMYVVVLNVTAPGRKQVTPPALPLQYGIVACGIAAALSVVYLRFVRMAGLTDAIEPVDPKAIATRIRTTYIASFVFAEATGLFGFVLAFINGDRRFYDLLFGLGVVLLIVCYPQSPSEE